jgi:hypothetical protein
VIHPRVSGTPPGLLATTVTVAKVDQPGLVARGSSTRRGGSLLPKSPCTSHGELASSSRSQIHSSPCRAYLRADLYRVSVNVRGGPPRDAAIVTQVVTQQAPLGVARRIRGLGKP